MSSPVKPEHVVIQFWNTCEGCRGVWLTTETPRRGWTCSKACSDVYQAVQALERMGEPDDSWLRGLREEVEEALSYMTSALSNSHYGDK